MILSTSGYDLSEEHIVSLEKVVISGNQVYRISISQVEYFIIPIEQFCTFCTYVLSNVPNPSIVDDFLRRFSTMPDAISEIYRQSENMQLFISLINIVNNISNLDRVYDGEENYNFQTGLPGSVLHDNLPPRNSFAFLPANLQNDLNSSENANIIRELIMAGKLYEFSVVNNINIRLFFKPYHSNQITRLSHDAEMMHERIRIFYNSVL